MAHPHQPHSQRTASAASAASARAILLHQAAALAACAERLADSPDGYERALDILHLALEGEPYAPSLGEDPLSLDAAPLSSAHLQGACYAQRRRHRGKLILSGVGKSGHIARKVTATLQSTGSMAVFLHPTEALHGDLGLVAEGDALVLFSHSGRSDELLALVAAVRRRDAADLNQPFGTPCRAAHDRSGGEGLPSPPPSPDSQAAPRTPIVVVCGDAGSPLGLASDAVVDARVAEESDACVPAPTASTTLAVAIGDCIALELARRRGFGSRDFARNHPGGNLGRLLKP